MLGEQVCSAASPVSDAETGARRGLREGQGTRARREPVVPAVRYARGTGRHAALPQVGGWLDRVAACAAQEPLIDSNTTVDALRQVARPAPPNAVFLGLGLCTRTQLSQALPLDVLGMLLPAERVRQAAGASRLVVLVADEHAQDNGFAAAEVEHRARETVAALTRMRAACGLERMTILRASEFHHGERYRAVRRQVAARLPERAHGYVERQIADVVYLDRVYGGILKVGWVRAGVHRGPRRDELGFDRMVRACFGDDIGFVYCKAGRVLADHARKAPPYIAVEPSLRVCLDPDEDPARKLATAEVSPDTVRCVRRHLGRLVYTYQRYVDTLRGPLEERVSTVIERVCAPLSVVPALPARNIANLRA
ncbi:hypothetical protein [Haliangium ochraceum]|uniref:Uncharacterized protein n=1 Tax=Haliangium ochraceum (strain DSM 14365 / JCM 11303 / SMP-2) TaxID=502025 RepID=D0LKW3_HALO1|nr:hypothetical protein [Haliangium ochraceum]ACY16683.1 hypothetical protein Hoch_4185 [Haliangium ochraceum DSM 14365]